MNVTYSRQILRDKIHCFISEFETMDQNEKHMPKHKTIIWNTSLVKPNNNDIL